MLQCIQHPVVGRGDLIIVIAPYLRNPGKGIAFYITIVTFSFSSVGDGIAKTGLRMHFRAQDLVSEDKMNNYRFSSKIYPTFFN